MDKSKIKYNFKDNVVLVTGAAQGIGESASRLFAKAGANLILVDKNYERVKILEDELKSIFRALKILSISADLTILENINDMVKTSIKYFGKIDILFNNAGISRVFPLVSCSYNQYREVMKINLDGMFFVAQAVGRTMIKRREGKIINNASMCGIILTKKRYSGVYSISKAGVIMMTKAFAVEWAEYNIRVNAIAPGFTRTPLLKKSLSDSNQACLLESLVPQERIADPDEIVNSILFLASSASSYITGHVLVIDGGYTLW